MLEWALILAIISLIANVLGSAGIAVGAVSTAEVLFPIFVVSFVLFLVLGITVFRTVDQRNQPSRKRGPYLAKGLSMRSIFTKTETTPEPTTPSEHAFRGVTVGSFTISLFAGHRVQSRTDGASSHAYRATNSANDAINRARYAARPIVEDVQNLLHLLENAIHTLTDEDSARANRASRALHARADQLRHAANERAHQACEHMDWALDHIERTTAAAPFKSVGVVVAIGTAIELTMVLAGGGNRRNADE